MRIPSSYSRSSGGSANEVMTPMIDVVFNLLIFFVVAAAGPVMELVLPTEMTASGSIESAERIERDPWIVEVWLSLRTDDAGQTVIDMNGRRFQQVTALDEPLSALAKLDAANPVILDIGPQIPMRDVIAVYDLCRRIGFQSINFAANAADVGRG